jgi:hypothetical protein
LDWRGKATANLSPTFTGKILGNGMAVSLNFAPARAADCAKASRSSGLKVQYFEVLAKLDDAGRHPAGHVSHPADAPYAIRQQPSPKTTKRGI